MGADPAFSLHFPGVRFLGTWSFFGLVTRLALSRERGMVAVQACPYLLRAFPGHLVAFDTLIPLWEPYPSSWEVQHYA